MKTEPKLVLKPDFTFSPNDFVAVGENGAVQLRPGQGGPAQAALDLRPPAPKLPPWAHLSDDQTTILNWRHGQQMHAKMVWITENVPKHKSLQKLMDNALIAYIDGLIAAHYKPEA